MSSLRKQAGLVLGASLILSALRTIIVAYTLEKNDFESNIYYLPDGNIAVGIFTAVAVLFSVFAIFLSLQTGNKSVVLDHKGGTAPASLVLAFLLIGASIVYVASKKNGGAMMGLVVLFAMLSAIAFLVLGFRSNSPDTPKNVLALLTMLPIAFSAVRLLNDFLSSSATPLASSGAYHILGLSAVLIYFLCEGKSHVGMSNSRTYFAFGYISVFLLLVYAVPNLLLSCFGILKFDCGAGFSAVDIGIAIYISTRMITASLKSNIPTDK